MQIRKIKSDRSTKRCGRIVGCLVCLFIATCAFIVFNTRQKANQKAQQGALRGKQDDQTLSKQQAQLEEQQKKIGEEEERQRKEDGELTRQKEGQEILLKQRLEAKQQAEYQELREELVKAEEKIASIANVVDGEANLDLASSKLPETLDGEDNEGQIEKVKVLVEEAKAKINKLESVLT